MSQTHFADIATTYARDIVEGRIPACKWVRLACRRHLADLRAATDGGSRWAWNPKIVDAAGREYRPAERACKFIHLLPHIKGEWASRRQNIHLEPWQVFIVASIFGWVDRETGYRRFLVADLFVPRKNAKSTLAAGIGLYMLTMDGEFGAEVYSGATSRAQAQEVFKPARLMALATAPLRKHLGVEVNASNLSVLTTNSKFEPIIGNPGDGASPSCAIVDEYHEHKTPDLYETMQTGMLARTQPLLLTITTAGADIGGPCYQHQQDLQKVLEGLLENDRRFGLIYGMDDEDDWTDPATLRKANPNFGVSISEEYLLGELEAAKNSPHKQNVFKTKHLNVWVGSASPWINLHAFQQAGDPALTLEAFQGQRCTVGLDLASKQDIASAVYVFDRIEDDGRVHYYAIGRHYCPASAVAKPENAHYQGWVNGGHLIATPGNMIDLEQIQDDLLTSAETVVIGEVAKDPWGGQQLGANLAAEGFTVVDIPQQTRYLSDPMKTIQALVDDGRFHHDGNPAFVWMFSNVEVQADRNDNIFPRKARAENKIDAAVATIVAMTRAMVPATVETEFFVL